MTQKLKLSPSILSANMAKLGEECVEVLDAGADAIHFDVMDNHYVPNLTIGPDVCKALRNYGITATIDVHLMTQDVDALIDKFALSGATHISIHPQSTKHLHRSLQLIKDLGCSAGIALNPSDPIEILTYCHHMISKVLIMTVNPGFGGQKMIEEVVPKVADVKKRYPLLSIQVDGGITVDNIATLNKAGADDFVAGSSIFGMPDRKAAIIALRAATSTK